MQTSDQINELAAALAKAQGAMKNAALNKVNPHFKSKYADLAGIRDTVTPALTANGIAVVQALDPAGENGVYLRTRLVHSSGQWIEGACPILNITDMQKMGSAITYARRYSLSAICGIAADEDDDANAAQQTAAVVAKATAKASPKGFDDWLTDLTAVADDGTAALQAVWKVSKTEYRQYLTTSHPQNWNALKAIAKLADDRVPA